MVKIGRIRRALHRVRSLSLDGRTTWPSFITIISEDDRGPSVISIANATVFPDGSVRAGGRWIVSEAFGLRWHRFPRTELKRLDGEYGFVLGHHHSMLKVVSSLGPRAASLGKEKPGLQVFATSGQFGLEPLFAQCGLRFGGVLTAKGAALRVGSAVFARIPNSATAETSVRQFAQLFGDDGVEPSGHVYLLSDPISGVSAGVVSPSKVDSRFAHESSGATLLSVNRMNVAKLAHAVESSAFVTLESETLKPLSVFARPSAIIHVADHTVPTSRDRSRFTQTGQFNIDEALRHGLSLPRGVEIISCPDGAVVDTTAENHRVFAHGRWRKQDPQVLREKSIGSWLISVKNAIVAPNGAVMLEDGTLLAGPYFGTPNYDFSIDGWVTSEVPERAGLALTRYSAFGHALLQVAPRVSALSKFDKSMTILANQVGWDDVKLIERCGSTPERVFRVGLGTHEHLVRVRELIVATHMQPEERTARSDPRTLNEFVTHFAATPPSTASRKVYLARDSESGNRGGCANREELTALAEEFGYETVFPERISLDEQIQLATSTTEMLGEQGSALTWSMFMPRGSRLVLVQNKSSLREDRAMTYQNSILASRGSSLYDIAAFRAGTPRNYEIEPRTVRHALERLR